MTIELLHRRRFVPLDGAVARKIAGNCFAVTIPLTDAVRRMVRAPERPESWDGAVLALDGVEAQPAVWSSATADAVTVTILT
jgi:hypothetical protein